MSDKLRVAVITEPTAWHLGALIDALHNQEVGQVAVGDVTGGTFDEVRQGGAGKVAATYTDLDELYRDFQPQVALITMEPWRMPPVITQALEAGAHVFHEKPGYVDLDDYRAIYRLAKSRGLHLAIAYISRAYPIVQEARRLIAEGFLGDLLSFQAWFVADQERTIQHPAARYEYDVAAGGWFFSKELGGGGHLTILGCHYLDLLCYFLDDRVVEVAALVGQQNPEEIEVEDTACLALRFSSGVLGTLHAGYHLIGSAAGYSGAAYDTFIGFRGTDGYLRLPREMDGFTVHSLAPGWEGKGKQDRVFEPAQSPAYGGVSGEEFLREFLRASRTGAPGPAPIDAAVHILEIIEAAIESSDTGRTVRIG
jgi:predicted dehydrogenase